MHFYVVIHVVLVNYIGWIEHGCIWIIDFKPNFMKVWKLLWTLQHNMWMKEVKLVVLVSGVETEDSTSWLWFMIIFCITGFNLIIRYGLNMGKNWMMMLNTKTTFGHEANTKKKRIRLMLKSSITKLRWWTCLTIFKKMNQRLNRLLVIKETVYGPLDLMIYLRNNSWSCIRGAKSSQH